MSVHFF